jgi:hypothetical protein
MADLGWDGTTWNNDDVIDNYGGRNFWGHKTFWSNSSGTDASPWGVTIGYS